MMRKKCVMWTINGHRRFAGRRQKHKATMQEQDKTGARKHTCGGFVREREVELIDRGSLVVCHFQRVRLSGHLFRHLGNGQSHLIFAFDVLEQIKSNAIRNRKLPK